MQMDWVGPNMKAERQDKMESVACIFCGSSQADVYADTQSRYDERKFTVAQCRQCKLVYTNPRIANKAQEIENHQPPPASIFEDAAILQAAVAAEMQILRLERYLQPGKLLDFGCGEGVLVHQACRRGWDAVGSDIDRALIQAGNAHWPGQRLLCDNLDSLIQKFGPTFDAIVSKQVFEHLSNPLEFLVQMRSLLRPGGIVLVDVPNLLSLGERLHRGSSLDPTAHLYYFTSHTIRRLFQRAGFAVLQCSGAPNMLGLYSRICRVFKAPYLAPKLSEITQKIPLPQFGQGVYAIGRMQDMPQS